MAGLRRGYWSDDKTFECDPDGLTDVRKTGTFFGHRRVVLESPYAGDVAENIEYARACLRDSLNRGEAPIASHLLYPQVLDDNNPEERQAGIDAGLAWLKSASASVVYADRGITKGMEYGIAAAKAAGLKIEIRYLRSMGA